jgi:hypothetical protein
MEVLCKLYTSIALLHGEESHVSFRGSTSLWALPGRGFKMFMGVVPLPFFLNNHFSDLTWCILNVAEAKIITQHIAKRIGRQRISVSGS